MANAQKESNLVDLPTEILGQIVQNLSFHDLLSVRCLFNNNIHAKTFRYCASELFETITTDLSFAHLAGLRELAITHPELILHVKTLRIAGNWGSYFPHRTGTIGRGLRWQRDQEGHLQGSNPGITFLQNLLLENLVNCRSFMITPDRLIRHTQDDVPPRYLTSCDVLLVICTIIARTGMAIHALHLAPEESPEETTERLWLDRKRLPLSTIQNPAFCTSWAGVSDLTLRIESTGEKWLPQLLSSTANLKSLTLEINPNGNSLSSLLDIVFCNPGCRTLQTLSLTRMDICGKSLIRLLQHCHRLHRLELLSIHLEPPYIWPDIFFEMVPLLPALKIFCVLNLMNIPFDGHHRPTHIPSLGSDRASSVAASMGIKLTRGHCAKRLEGVVADMGVRYEGKEMSKALDLIARSAEVTSFPRGTRAPAAVPVQNSLG